MAKISVVIPVYGVERYIDQLLDSIRKQNFTDYEVIFVDDGSPDKCPEILDAFCAEDSRYKVIHQKNGGVSVARNTGLDQATGEYVYIIDSDDWLADDALSNLWAEAERSNSDLIYGDWYLERESGAVYRSPFEKPFVTEDMQTIKALHCALNNNGMLVKVSRPEFSEIRFFGGAPWRAMIKRSLIADNNLRYDPYVKGLGDDILFMLHVYEHVKKVAYIRAPLYHYRLVEMSYSHGFKANLLEVYELIFEKMEKFLVDNNKSEEHWKAFYFRVFLYFQQAMVRYFKNTQNPASEKERFEMMKKLLKTEPYSSAVKNAPLNIIDSKKMKLAIILLRMGLYKVYWMLNK